MDRIFKICVTFKFSDFVIRSLLSFGHEKNSTTILTLPLIQEGQLSVTGERRGPKYW